MITQTLALFLDAYRDLNARKLFWVTLILSAVFIAGFGLLGADAKGFGLLWFHWDMPMAAYLYKKIFSYVVIGFWLTLAAAVLAMVSTAGIFPDLLSTGAIDLYLAKPLGRLRLFLTKYVTGLLFVALQVALVAVGGVLLMRIRGGEWKPGLLLAIPIVVCFFSYLFAVVVLFGIVTRSTIAALLLGIVCWGGFWAVHVTEAQMFQSRVAQEYLVDFYRGQLSEDNSRLREIKATTQPDAAALADASTQRASDQEALDSVEKSLPTLRRVHQIAYGIKTVLPKTTETTDLLDRVLFTNAEVQEADEQRPQWMGRGGSREFEAQMNAAQHAKALADQGFRNRSLGWVIGSSLGFEVVVLALAAWVFCRRDY